MSTPNAQAGAMSFAHLAGITTPIHAAKAETDEDKKDAKKAEDDSDDETMESDEPKEDAAAAADEPDEDDGEKKDAKKAEAPADDKQAVAAERARWATVLGDKAFARAPAAAAKMLATTDLSAEAILGVLQDVPAAPAGSDARSARNPNLGVAAAAAPAPNHTDRLLAAARRAGVIKA